MAAKDSAAGAAPELTSFIDSLPRKRMASSMLLCNIEGAVLLVEPTYKLHWELPGGVVEGDESPRDAAQREIAEELGFEYPAGRLLVLDWVPPAVNRSEGVIAVFDGGILSSIEVERRRATGINTRFRVLRGRGGRFGTAAIAGTASGCGGSRPS